MHKEMISAFLVAKMVLCFLCHNKNFIKVDCQHKFTLFLIIVITVEQLSKNCAMQIRVLLLILDLNHLIEIWLDLSRIWAPRLRFGKF